MSKTLIHIKPDSSSEWISAMCVAWTVFRRNTQQVTKWNRFACTKPFKNTELSVNSDLFAISVHCDVFGL